VIALVLMLAAAIGSLPRVYTPDTSVEGYTKVPPPNIRMRMNEASATTVPWIDSNASRYMRGVKKAFYAKLPAGSAPLAAAEAFAYGIDAILEPAPDDKQALDTMLEFLRRVDAHRMPMLANIGIVDDGSPEMAEVLNLLSRRNLLYRVVTCIVSSPRPTRNSISTSVSDRSSIRAMPSKIPTISRPASVRSSPMTNGWSACSIRTP
jgi:hypothetical protein